MGEAVSCPHFILLFPNPFLQTCQRPWSSSRNSYMPSLKTKSFLSCSSIRKTSHAFPVENAFPLPTFYWPPGKLASSSRIRIIPPVSLYMDALAVTCCFYMKVLNPCQTASSHWIKKDKSFLLKFKIKTVGVCVCVRRWRFPHVRYWIFLQTHIKGKVCFSTGSRVFFYLASYQDDSENAAELLCTNKDMGYW